MNITTKIKIGIAAVGLGALLGGCELANKPANQDRVYRVDHRYESPPEKKDDEPEGYGIGRIIATQHYAEDDSWREFDIPFHVVAEKESGRKMNIVYRCNKGYLSRDRLFPDYIRYLPLCDKLEAEFNAFIKRKAKIECYNPTFDPFSDYRCDIID